MYKSYKIEVERCFLKLSQLAKNKSSYLDFYEYLDKLISTGRYQIFVDTMMLKYDFEIKKGVVSDIRNKAWKHILFHTTETIQEKINKIAKANNLYINGIYLYRDSDNYKLAEIREFDSYFDDIDRYAFTEHEYQERLKNKKTFVKIIDIDGEKIFNEWNNNHTYEKNLLNIYKTVFLYINDKNILN